MEFSNVSAESRTLFPAVNGFIPINASPRATSPVDTREETSRKRQSHEVDDGEAQPNPSRLRLSTGLEKRTIISGPQDEPKRPIISPSKSNDVKDMELSDAESMFTSLGEDDGCSEVALGYIPEFWADIKEADRMLYNMKAKGANWPDIRQAWKEKTGKETAHNTLPCRYQVLKKRVQSLREVDDKRLLAAVEEVKAKFEREKWQLVSEAMARAGAVGYAKEYLQKYYKKLTQSSPILSTIGGYSPKVTEKSATSLSTKTQSFDHGETSEMTPVESTKTQIIDVGGVETKVQVQPAAVAPGIASIKSPINPIPRKVEATERAHTGKPGAAHSNAILVEDAAPEHFLVLPRPTGAGPTMNASRKGSATNRGPARFASYDKSTDGNSIRKSRNALDSAIDAVRTEPNALDKAVDAASAEQPTRPTFSGFGMLVNKGSKYDAPHKAIEAASVEHPTLPTRPMFSGFGMLVNKGHKYKSPHSPLNIQAAVTRQQNNHPSQDSLPDLAHSQQPIPRAPIHNGLPLGTGVPASQTPLESLTDQKPPEMQVPNQSGPIPIPAPIQSIEAPPQDGVSTPVSVNSDPAEAQRSPGRPKKVVTNSQFKYMINYRTLNEANRSKSWETVAQECGIKASQIEIIAALEKSLQESTDLSPTNYASASPMKSTERTTYISPFTATPTTEATAAIASSAPPAVSGEHVRALETPAPTDTSQPEETPRTRSKRGRPPLPQSEKKSPSNKSPDPIRGAAMVAVWRRRKAKQTDGRHGGPSKPSTVVKNSIMGNSPSAFAAQILAAAAAQASPTPTLAPQTARAEAATTPVPDPDEPVDLLTGQSMFAQHWEDAVPIQAPGQMHTKKIRGPYKKKEKAPKEFIRGPHRKSLGADMIKATRQFACQKCGKNYQQKQGLNYHFKNHPNCENEPRKADSRTDPPNIIKLEGAPV